MRAQRRWAVALDAWTSGLRVIAEAVYSIDHTCRQASLVECFHQHLRLKGAEFAGLDHHGTAGGKHRGRLAADEPGVAVPRGQQIAKPYGFWSGTSSLSDVMLARARAAVHAAGKPA